MREEMATQVVSTVQVIEALLARSAVYHALSVLLRHPDAETSAWLASRQHHRLLEVLERLGPESRLQELARRLTELLDTVPVSDLRREHERTFGHAVQGAAPPYELEYGEEHSHREPQELGDIAAFYQAFGLRVALAAHERADHLVT